MEQTIPKAVIMDDAALSRAITRIAHEIIEHNEGTKNIALVGIIRRGETIAMRLADEIQKLKESDLRLARLISVFIAMMYGAALHRCFMQPIFLLRLTVVISYWLMTCSIPDVPSELLLMR